MMLFSFITLILPIGFAHVLPPNTQYSLSSSSSRIPTVHESAIQARRILHLSSIGTFSTIFPDSTSSSSTDTQDATTEPVKASRGAPSDVSLKPIGLPDYFADCEFASGNPTILELSIGTSFRNVAAGSNLTLSVRWEPPAWQGRGYYSAAALPRFSMVGYLEDIREEEVDEKSIAACYAGYHPDATLWFPGNDIHTSKWARLVVQEVYWIGGFGDRAYIGWIPLEVWKSVTLKEIDSITLPGEE